MSNLSTPYLRLAGRLKRRNVVVCALGDKFAPFPSFKMALKTFVPLSDRCQHRSCLNWLSKNFENGVKLSFSQGSLNSKLVIKFEDCTGRWL